MLSSVPPPPPLTSSQNPDPPKLSSRRQTVFNVAAGEVTTGPPTNSNRSAPGAIPPWPPSLGGDLRAQIVRREGDGAIKGDVDIEILLRGAEALQRSTPYRAHFERIPAQRQKFANQSNTIAYYEAKVSEQQEALERMNKDPWMDVDPRSGREEFVPDAPGAAVLTDEDLRRRGGGGTGSGQEEERAAGRLQSLG